LILPALSPNQLYKAPLHNRSLWRLMSMFGAIHS